MIYEEANIFIEHNHMHCQKVNACPGTRIHLRVNPPGLRSFSSTESKEKDGHAPTHSVFLKQNKSLSISKNRDNHFANYIALN